MDLALIVIIAVWGGSFDAKQQSMNSVSFGAQRVHLRRGVNIFWRHASWCWA